MRTFLFSFLLLLSVKLKAQMPDGSVEKQISIDLNEATIKASGLKEYQHRIGRSRTLIHFAPNQQGGAPQWDSLYFLTKLVVPDSEKSIKPISLECSIYPFDTSLFNLQLVVIQLNPTDTLFKVIPIQNIHEIRKKHLTLDLREHNIILQPGNFFMGYGFQVKAIPNAMVYSFYASNGGEGTMLKIKGGKWKLTSSETLPYIFPFKMKYLTQ